MDNLAYAHSISFVEADRISAIAGFSASYDAGYDQPRTTVSLKGGRQDVQAAISGLGGGKLGRGKITALDGTDIELTFDAKPSEVIEAAMEGGLLSDPAKWQAMRVATQAETIAEERRTAESTAASLGRWRKGETAAPSRARAPASGQACTA